jgi:ArsR family transcriptional regulator
MRPEQLFTALSDPTRLRALMLIAEEGELCVCELTFALGESQPKISRHLASMRAAGIVKARRQGTWMHYRISPDLPAWAQTCLEDLLRPLRPLDRFTRDRSRLGCMADRPGEAHCA